MTFPMWCFVPSGSELIGKSIDELLTEFKIDQALEYSYCKLPRKNFTTPEDFTEIKGEKRFGEGIILFIGTLSTLKELSDKYKLVEDF
mgnify:CR=1 FL=1